MIGNMRKIGSEKPKIGKNSDYKKWNNGVWNCIGFCLIKIQSVFERIYRGVCKQRVRNP
jgi:hypothetical protein